MSESQAGKRVRPARTRQASTGIGFFNVTNPKPTGDESSQQAGKRAKPARTRQASTGVGFFDVSSELPEPANGNDVSMIGEESSVASPVSCDRSRNGKQIATIGEEFYNSVAGSYESDDEEESDNTNSKNLKSSSETEKSPQAPDNSNNQDENEDENNGENGEKNNNEGGNGSDDNDNLSERSNESRDKRDVSNGEDTLLLSERSTPGEDKRDTSTGEDTLMMSERLTPAEVQPNHSQGEDTLIMSERSTPAEVQPTNSQGEDSLMDSERLETVPVSEKGDVMTKSENSGANFRDNSTGYDSLLVSETTDESWQKMASTSNDSSISSAPSAPFPKLEEFENELKEGSKQMVEKQTSETPSNSKNKVTKDDGGGSDEDDRPLHGQDIEAVLMNADTNIEEGTLPPNPDGDNDYDGSISTNNTLRNNELRARRIPRRWIIDRIDGKVRSDDDELPEWRRKPPLFLCLPSPLLGIFPWLLEENSCCVAIGKFGFFGGDNIEDDNKTRSEDLEQNNRDNNNNIDVNNETPDNFWKSASFFRMLVIGHALLLNGCGFFATMLAGLALTRSNPSLLSASSFGKTTVIPTLSTQTAGAESVVTGDAVTLHLGLLALGIDNPTASDVVLVAFRDFCETPGTEQFLDPEECETCADVSLLVVVGYFLAMVAYLPTFSIGISRLYTNYDANCSKVLAGIWSMVSLIGYIIVLSCYNSCLGSLYDGEVIYTSEGAIQSDNIVEEPVEEFLVAEFDWKAGVGQILFLIGLVLKIFDIAFNSIVATPAITRSRELQWEYESGSPTTSQPESNDSENGNPQEGSPVVDRIILTDSDPGNDVNS